METTAREQKVFYRWVRGTDFITRAVRDSEMTWERERESDIFLCKKTHSGSKTRPCWGDLCAEEAHLWQSVRGDATERARPGAREHLGVEAALGREGEGKGPRQWGQAPALGHRWGCGAARGQGIQLHVIRWPAVWTRQPECEALN